MTPSDPFISALPNPETDLKTPGNNASIEGTILAFLGLILMSAVYLYKRKKYENTSEQ